MIGELLSSVTAGRLILCSEAVLRGSITSPPQIRAPLKVVADATAFRHIISSAAAESGMDQERIDALQIAVMEAASNTVKHGGGGTAEAWIGADAVTIVVRDRGAGIPMEQLTRSILEAGYSTTQTLGIGFTMMLAVCDKLLVETSSSGTSLLLKVGRGPSVYPIPFSIKTFG